MNGEDEKDDVGQEKEQHQKEVGEGFADEDGKSDNAGVAVKHHVSHVVCVQNGLSVEGDWESIQQRRPVQRPPLSQISKKDSKWSKGDEDEDVT